MRFQRFDSSSDRRASPDIWAIRTSSALTLNRSLYKRSEAAARDSCSLNLPERCLHNEVGRNYWLDKHPVEMRSPAEEDICELTIPC